MGNALVLRVVDFPGAHEQVECPVMIPARHQEVGITEQDCYSFFGTQATAFGTTQTLAEKQAGAQYKGNQDRTDQPEGLHPSRQ